MKYQTDERGFIRCTNSKGITKHFSPHLIEMAFAPGNKPETYLKGFAPIAPLDDEVDLIDVAVKPEETTLPESKPISGILEFDFDEQTIAEGKSEINRLLAEGYSKSDITELIEKRGVQKKGIINYVKELK